MVARSQTVEDGAPRDQVVYTWHRDGLPCCHARAVLVARRVDGPTTRRLVLRDYTGFGVWTAAIETLRTED